MLEQAKILIVDDEPVNVDYLEQELEDLGYQTVRAAGGSEALAKAMTETPDLILLDVMMPSMDGFTVCRRLKAQDETRFIPVVMMTALGAKEDRIRGIEAGADDFLTKPVDQRELQARLRTAVRMKRAMDDKFCEMRQITSHLTKFVPEVVTRLVTANPQAPEFALREQDLSIMFVDISNYARLSEQLSLEQVNALVERYFSNFLDFIRKAGGDITETAGDGFMAIFQDADAKQHARKAVDTACLLLTVTETLNQEGRGHPIAIHVGINSGIALVGSIRFEGFQGVRWTFSATGPMTNVASRLAGVATANQIVMGPETVRRLGNSRQIERLGRVRLKNLEEAIDIYRVLRP
jgi:DNA-binding response OmpR family regulator